MRVNEIAASLWFYGRDSKTEQVCNGKFKDSVTHDCQLLE